MTAVKPPASHRIVQFAPARAEYDDVRGLYLADQLHRRDGMIYADFVMSLDGRIAAGRDGGLERLSSGADLRLLLELQAQADCLVTHGAYLKRRAAGTLGDVLRIGRLAAHRDLADWRAAEGLPPQPRVVVCSASLDFPEPVELGPEIAWIATGREADAARVRHWQDLGYRVLTAGSGRLVEGGALAAALRAEGLRTIFLLAGPTLLESMAADRQLDRLYLTVTHRLLGGAEFQTMAPGLRALPGDCRLTQTRLLFDTGDTHSQWFATFDCRYAPDAPA